MIVSIHQPSFIPWLPFFQKIQAADLFVFLRHCQFQKGNYQNRFFYEGRWHTMSVNSGFQSIHEKRYVSHEKDWRKIRENLKSKKLLSCFDDVVSDNLEETNTQIILQVMKMMNIDTSIRYDEPTQLTGTDRLVDICKKMNASAYLSGPSGKNYLELDKFKTANIDVIFHETKDEDKVHILDRLPF